MEVRSEQLAVIKFCIRLNKSGAETVTLLQQPYQDEHLGHSTILRWHHAFVEGRDSAALTPHGGRPTTATSPINVNMVSVVIEEDRHLNTEKNCRTLEYDVVVCKPNFAPASSNAESVTDVGSASPKRDFTPMQHAICDITKNIALQYGT